MEKIDLESTQESPQDNEDIVKGYVGWVYHEGNYIPAKVVSRNKRKKTAFVKFFSLSGLQKIKQLVPLQDIRAFEDHFNKFIIGHNDQLNQIFLLAEAEKV